MSYLYEKLQFRCSARVYAATMAIYVGDTKYCYLLTLPIYGVAPNPLKHSCRSTVCILSYNGWFLIVCPLCLSRFCRDVLFHCVGHMTSPLVPLYRHWQPFLLL